MGDRGSAGGDCAAVYRAGLKRLLSMEWLPTPIGVLADVLRILENWTGDSTALERRINRDPSLTAQILRVANSAYYGCQQEVSTVSRAIVVIGIKEVRNICISVALIQQFQGLEPASCFDRDRFWIHCFAVANHAALLADDLGLECKEGAYVLGLLHDIGRLVMAYHLPDIFDQIANGVSRGQAPYQHEKEVCLTHAEVGFWLCKKWKLPPVVCEVARWHHEPSEAEKFPLETALVHVSGSAVKSSEEGGDDPDSALIPEEDVLNRLNMGQGKYLLYVEKAEECLEKARKMWAALFGG